MGDLLDPNAFPECARYLAELGGDLGAHPQCETRTEFFVDLVSAFPELLDHESIAPAIRNALAIPPPGQAWVRTVPVVLALTMVRDGAFPSDEAFLDWNFERQLRIYRKPVFRALMFVLSPTLLFMGAARRWTAVHRGTTLTVGGTKRDAEITLEFPQKLCSRVFLISLVAAFRAALVAARAENPKMELAQSHATKAVYRATWG